MLKASNYDVLLLPKGYFKPYEKKFDVFLLRDNILLECDLKTITSHNPDTIGNRIKEGSDQAPRIVLDITSKISKNDLIVALKTGSVKNEALAEVMLFYNSNFYRLKKDLILSKKIFDTLK